jgi:RNA polymerase-binding transcription factor DksA
MTSLRARHAAAQSAGKRLEQELNMALNRRRQRGGAVVVDELPGAIGDNSPFADEVDDIQATAGRDIGLATPALLVERVNRLSAALHRLHDGEYGVCVDCGAPVSMA